MNCRWILFDVCRLITEGFVETSQYPVLLGTCDSRTRRMSELFLSFTDVPNPLITTFYYSRVETTWMVGCWRKELRQAYGLKNLLLGEAYILLHKHNCRTMVLISKYVLNVVSHACQHTTESRLGYCISRRFSSSSWTGCWIYRISLWWPVGLYEEVKHSCLTPLHFYQ